MNLETILDKVTEWCGNESSDDFGIYYNENELTLFSNDPETVPIKLLYTSTNPTQEREQSNDYRRNRIQTHTSIDQTR